MDRNNLELVLVLLLSFLGLIGSAMVGVFIAYSLLLSLFFFSVALINRGIGLLSLFRMAWSGIQRSLPVIYILLLIGAMTAIWMAAGTVPALVYYGTSLISPRFFVLWAFVLTGALSVLTGTAFGSVGTLGLALMAMARSAGGDTELMHPVAGAIMAGAFLGDRCSPMSSSAHLVASMTQTSLYNNLRNMMVSSRWPLAIALVFYAALSLRYPIPLDSNAIASALPDFFDLSGTALLPAILILLLATFRVNVKVAMAASIGLAAAIAHMLQGYSLWQLVCFSCFGFQLPSELVATEPLQSVFQGGGLVPMVKATVLVVISTAFAGIFAGSQVLDFAERWLRNIRTQQQRSRATVVVALFANAFGCSQTIAILLTQQIMQPYYSKESSGYLDIATDCATEATEKEQLALAIEDTAVVMAPLVPWNIAFLVPTAVLSVGPGVIPYALYLLLLPLFMAIRKRSLLYNASTHQANYSIKHRAAGKSAQTEVAPME